MKPDYYVKREYPIVNNVLLMRCVDGKWAINATSNDSTPPCYGHNRDLSNGWIETYYHKTEPLKWRHISNTIAETMWPNLTK